MHLLSKYVLGAYPVPETACKEDKLNTYRICHLVGKAIK